MNSGLENTTVQIAIYLIQVPGLWSNTLLSERATCIFCLPLPLEEDIYSSEDKTWLHKKWTKTSCLWVINKIIILQWW